MNTKRMAVVRMVVFLLVCGFVISGVRAQSSGHGAEGATVPPGAEKKAEEQFKNIQVLKGVPADQIFPTMQFIAASLGVECEFCHVQGAFDKDDKKPKANARKMMAMMFAINKGNFEGHREVTCYSCHRGSADPVGMPPVISDESKEGIAEPRKPESEAKQYSGPSAEQLLDKYVQAAGGAAAIDKITTRVMKGTIDFEGKPVAIDIYAKDPEKRISVMHEQNGDNVTAFNGHEGWMQPPGHPLREMHGNDLDGAGIDADLHLAAHLKTMFTEVKVQGTEKVGDREVYVVEGQREGKTPIRLYFDEQTGLLARLVRFGETALGRLPTQIDYADYRDAGGVRIPYRWTLARPSARFTIQVSEVQENVPVDDAMFVKPASPEPPKGPGK